MRSGALRSCQLLQRGHVCGPLPSGDVFRQADSYQIAVKITDSYPAPNKRKVQFAMRAGFCTSFFSWLRSQARFIRWRNPKINGAGSETGSSKLATSLTQTFAWKNKSLGALFRGVHNELLAVVKGSRAIAKTPYGHGVLNYCKIPLGNVSLLEN